MEIQEIYLQKEEKLVRYTHIKTQGSSVCFMLAGASYNYHHPLFYYATMLMIEKGIDVVHIHYQYEANLLDTYEVEDISALMMADIQPVIIDVFNKYHYQRTILLGKSLGTIPLTLSLLKNETFRKAQIVLLTPLLKYHPIQSAISHMKQQGLLVIGDQDPHFQPEAILEIEKKSVSVKRIEGANHSLDIGYHTEESLQTLQSVMNELQKFISSCS